MDTFTAQAKYLRVSPKKIRVLVAAIKKMRLTEALTVLSHHREKGSKYLEKVILSSLANARSQNNLTKENLFIKEIIISQGPVFKRMMPVARGTGHQYKKRTSHLTVTLERIKPVEKTVNTKVLKKQTEKTGKIDTSVKKEEETIAKKSFSRKDK